MAKSATARTIVIPVGSEVIREEVRGTYGREHREIFVKSGGYVWKHRKKLYSDAQFHAANKFCEAWERAGMNQPQSVDWARPPAPRGSYKGISADVCDAMNELRTMAAHLGKLVTTRLLDHVVHNMSVKEVAEKWGFSERNMAAVLDADLKAAAEYFGYDPNDA